MQPRREADKCPSARKQRHTGRTSRCLIALFATGCIGNNGLTNEVVDWNLSLTESPGWRATWGFCLLPVYWATGWCDLLIFNSIEFWSGENPINGKPRLVDRDIGGDADDVDAGMAEQ